MVNLFSSGFERIFYCDCLSANAEKYHPQGHCRCRRYSQQGLPLFKIEDPD